MRASRSHSATFKGGPDQEAVLCTSGKTFAVKDVGTSNLLMLVPPEELSEGDG